MSGPGPGGGKSLGLGEERGQKGWSHIAQEIMAWVCASCDNLAPGMTISKVPQEYDNLNLVSMLCLPPAAESTGLEARGGCQPVGGHEVRQGTAGPLNAACVTPHPQLSVPGPWDPGWRRKAAAGDRFRGLSLRLAWRGQCWQTCWQLWAGQDLSASRSPRHPAETKVPGTQHQPSASERYPPHRQLS